MADATFVIKRPKPHDIAPLLEGVSRGQQEVALALIGYEPAPTYPEVAEILGVHLGTVYTHLRRLRLRRPEAYASLMEERARQLAERHDAAVARAEAHSREWHRRQRNRRYYYRFGEWPWERRHRAACLRLRRLQAQRARQ